MPIWLLILLAAIQAIASVWYYAVGNLSISVVMLGGAIVQIGLMLR